MSKDVKIKDVLDFLYKEWAAGGMYIQAFQLLNEDSLSHIEGITRRLFHFLTLTRSAYLAMAILSLGNLLKKADDGICIDYLLNLLQQIKQKKELFSEVQKGRGELEQLRKRAKPLIAVRDQILAHLDKKHVNNPTEITRIHETVKYGDIAPLYKILVDLLNKYSRLLGYLPKEQEIRGWRNDFDELLILLDLGFLVRQERLNKGIHDQRKFPPLSDIGAPVRPKPFKRRSQGKPPP